MLGRRQSLAAKPARALPRRDRLGGHGPELAVRGDAEQALDFGNVELVLHLTATESSHAPRIDSGPMKRVGILTGGGDCPGLNAVIRAVARRSFDRGYEVVGVRDGWRGLVDERH